MSLIRGSNGQELDLGRYNRGDNGIALIPNLLIFNSIGGGTSGLPIFTLIFECIMFSPKPTVLHVVGK